jgi:transposase
MASGLAWRRSSALSIESKVRAADAAAQHCDPVGRRDDRAFHPPTRSRRPGIDETIKQDAELRRRCDLLLSVIGVGETLAASLLVEMPEPEVLRRSSEMVAYAGLNPSHHRSGTSIDRPTRISKIGNATLRSSLFMPALSAMRFNPAVAALATRLKQAGRLTPKQIVVAAMRKLLVICFGVLKTGKPFDPAIAMPA